MKNLWLFGDSFTYGYGATPGSPYHRKVGGGKTFSNLLSEDYNLKEVNKGLPGRCNNAIIRYVIENLQYIKKGDMVILSNTSPLRDLVPVSPDFKYEERHYEHIRFGLTSQKLISSEHYPESIGHKDSVTHRLLSDYALTVKSPFISNWNSHYRSIYINFVKYFISIGCTSIFWDYSVWSEEEEEGMKFENIYEATNGEVYDLHWSFKGHRDAFEWIRDGIKKGKKVLK